MCIVFHATHLDAVLQGLGVPPGYLYLGLDRFGIVRVRHRKSSRSDDARWCGLAAQIRVVRGIRWCYAARLGASQ